MAVGRYVGIAMVVLGIACGLAILAGSFTGRFPAGLLRTWAAFGVLAVGGLILSSLFSGVEASERVVGRAGLAILLLGFVAGASLVLNAGEIISLQNPMQGWALFASCVIVGGAVVFGSRA